VSVDIHTKSTAGQSENTQRREIVGYDSGVTEDLVFLLVTVFLWANSSRSFNDRSAYIFRVNSMFLDFLTLHMKALRLFETSETAGPTKQCHMLEDLDPQHSNILRN
jgi:hypothetical protein